uniref:Plant heme peroxidase family profile domain-containing protein n=1 Tax=Aegilops tauschii subsp. strangulata TaxID=200361 RepID=A0A453I533_AEGTS
CVYRMIMAFFGVPVVAVLLLGLAAAASAQLSATFYDASCPSALATIKSGVTAAVSKEPRMGASLLRLHFHDCFVQCDSSVLLADTANFTGEQTRSPTSTPSGDSTSSTGSRRRSRPSAHRPSPVPTSSPSPPGTPSSP